MDTTTQQIQKIPLKSLGSDNKSGSVKPNVDFRPFPYKTVPGRNEIVKIVEQEKPKEPSFSEKDLLEGRQKGYEEGYSKGFSTAKSAESEIAKKVQECLNDITIKLAAITEAVKTRNNAHIKELMELVLRIARKVAGTALKNEPYGEIENIIKNSLPILFDEPTIIIYVNPDLVKNIEEQITTLAKKEGFKNNIEISGNPALSSGSCDIEWNGGGIKSNKDVVWNQIENLCECLN